MEPFSFLFFIIAFFETNKPKVSCLYWLEDITTNAFVYYIEGQPDSIVLDIENMVRSYIEKVIFKPVLDTYIYLFCVCWNSQSLSLICCIILISCWKIWSFCVWATFSKIFFLVLKAVVYVIGETFLFFLLLPLPSSPFLEKKREWERNDRVFYTLTLLVVWFFSEVHSWYLEIFVIICTSRW